MLPAVITEQLAALVQRDDGITALNIIRADQKDFQYTAVRMEVDKALRIEDLYQFSRDFQPSLALSNNGIIMDDKVLTGADGQKFATTDSTIQSRYSRKYLGKGHGISLYTLLANYVAVNAKNISLNEFIVQLLERELQ
ncbi:transposase [Salmonella enterica subsp. enterica serovar Ball]|nr:transposase [Salmonella enterica subsp. enterica serovar Ball]